MAILSCANHPSRAAAFHCSRCELLLCADVCRVRKELPCGPRLDAIDQCASCEALLRPVDPTYAVPDAGARAYLGRLPELLRFPVHRPVLFILLGMTVLTAPLWAAVHHNISPALALLGLVLVMGIEASVYFRFVSLTAHGAREIDPPDVTDVWGDLIGPLLRYLLALAPVIAAVIWFGRQLGSVVDGVVTFTADATTILDHPGPAALLIVGLLLLPLLTIIAAVSQSARAVVDPILWFRTLRVLGWTYVAAVGAFYAVLLFEAAVWAPLIAYVRHEHGIPIVSGLVGVALGYLPMALRARLLGAAVEPHMASLRH